MGLLKRLPITVICLVIAALATAEGWLAWRYFQVSRRMELSDRQAEVNHLIFLRDSERRHARLATSGSQNPAASAPTSAPISAEDELAQATAQALQSPPLRPSRRESNPQARAAFDRLPARAVLPAPVPGLAPLEDLDASDTIASPQGAAPLTAGDGLTPADIDPKHLVNMANIMTGKDVAELTRMRGTQVIRYKNTRPTEDDPVWHLLDAVGQAGALKEITLAGDSTQDGARLQKLSATLSSAGVPSNLIHIRTADPDYRGLEGILISLVKKKEDPMKVGKNP